ncbi:hypothetical protein ABT168_08635 [Streptomyces sp. NPDC001793]|uniref:hypothetical protein n=1 Tax=Streptomyces sp. NPDC001793 TaxID=3154657 RepID=UPI00332F8803
MTKYPAVVPSSVVEAMAPPRRRSMFRLIRSGLRSLSCAVASVLLACGTVVGTASAAHASGTLLHCEGYFSTTYSPPLTNTPRQTKVTFHNDLDYCPVGGVTSGDASGEFTAVRGCTTLDLPPHPATTTFQWNTGVSSTISFSTSTVDRLADGTTVVTSYGTVTTGFDQGAQAVHTAVQPQLDPLACAGSGVASVSGPEQLEFLG